MKERIKGIIEKYKNDCDYFEIRIEKFDEQRIIVAGQEVESINNKIVLGGNVRALHNGGWGFVSFNNMDNLEEYVEDAISKAKLVGSSKSMLAKADVIEDEVKLDVARHPRSISLDDKISLFKSYTKLINDYNKEIKMGKVSYFDMLIDLIFANSEGTFIKQEKVDIGCSISCVAIRGNDSQMQFASTGSISDIGIIFNLEEKIKMACQIAVGLLDAPKIKGGKYNIIINPVLAGVFIHEAFGHLSEGDNVYENERLKEILKIGNQFGPEFLNVFDSGVEGTNRGDLPYDDEGVRTEKTYLIKNGKLVGRLHSRETAGKMNEKPTGNARALSYKYEPIPRMRVTGIESGNSSFDELLKDIKFGVYAVDMIGGNTTHELFTFSAAYGYMIRDGKIAELVRDINLSGNVFDTLKNIVALGNDYAYYNAVCGKAGQFPLPVSMAAPHVKIKDVIIGGDAE